MGADFRHISDEELFTRYKKEGEESCLNVLWSRYHYLVFGASVKYLRNTDQAKDAKQMVFQKLVELPKDYSIEKFNAWIGVVTRNYCLEQLRKRKGVEMKVGDWMVEEEEDKAELEEKLRHLEGKLSLLNRAQQLCIRLFYLQGKSYKEVSELSGFSADEVKSHIQNGKRNLRHLFFSE